jgi:hypothetical protein
MSQLLSFLNPFLFCFVLFITSSFSEKPTCDPEGLLKTHVAELGDYKFIKAFPVVISKKGATDEFSYVLSKETSYCVVVCPSGDNELPLLVTLLNREKKAVASNYNKATRKFEREIKFECADTGVYYVQSSFKGEGKGCGLNILGFRK